MAVGLWRGSPVSRATDQRLLFFRPRMRTPDPLPTFALLAE